MAVSVDEVEVLLQNRAFYAAFRQRDFDSMDGLWAQRVQVACVHPGWQPIRGREQVMASWRAILGQAQVPQIRCEDATAHVLGDTAFVLCEEVLGEGRLVATNVFVREEGDWRLVHHQAGPMAPSIEVGSEDGDDGETALGGAEFPGSDLLAGLRLRRRGEVTREEAGFGAGDDDDEGDAEAELGALDGDPELGDLRAGEDALAGGGLTGRGRSAALTTDPESRPRLDLSDLSEISELPEREDTEAPEVFFNLGGPASRRLLN